MCVYTHAHPQRLTESDWGSSDIAEKGDQSQFALLVCVRGMEWSSWNGTLLIQGPMKPGSVPEEQSLPECIAANGRLAWVLNLPWPPLVGSAL